MRLRRQAVLALAGALLLGGAALGLDRALPPRMERFLDRSRIVAARDGAPLRVFLSRDDKWRLLTRPADVDPLYLDMLIAYEDSRFRRHKGFDPISAARAAVQAATTGRIVSGASTLTMQAAKLLEPRPRTAWAKAIEIGRAFQLERRFDKDATLSIYLTLAPFGGAVEGVRAASLKLFGREPKLLTPAEAALLVALPQSPNARRPDRAPAAARAARARVLERAVAAGVVSADEAAAANAAVLPEAYGDFPFLAPHFAEEAASAAEADGSVRTTIDAALQALVERRMRTALKDHAAPTTAAAIVVDAETAEIRAIVGGPDYFDRRRAGMLDMTRALRSPGSALKPFIYALAFDRLLAAPATLIADRPFRETGYAPTNFDGGYAGDVTVADALVRSLNIPAVKMLRRVGPARFDAAFATAGLDLSYDRDGGDAGLALALGGVGLDLRDLARAYLALAGRGAMPDRLVGRAGDRADWRPFVGQEAAADVRWILAEAPPPAGHARGTGQGPAIAYKTGTSYGYRDALAVGMARGHVVAVWVGRPDGASCIGCIGIAAAAPILFDLAQLLPGDGGRALQDRMPAPPPPHLRRFDAPDTGGADGPPIEIRFPVAGAELQLAASGAAPLVAVGGRPPYRWVGDGAPVARSGRGVAARWEAPGPGFHELTDVDAAGQAATVRFAVSESQSGETD